MMCGVMFAVLNRFTTHTSTRVCDVCVCVIWVQTNGWINNLVEMMTTAKERQHIYVNSTQEKTHICAHLGIEFVTEWLEDFNMLC